MKNILLSMGILSAVVVGNVAFAETDSVSTDVRFSQFIGAGEQKLEAMVGLVVDLRDEGLTEQEIVQKILDTRTNTVADKVSDDEFESFLNKNITLKKGAAGGDVLLMQRVLNALGLGIGELSLDGSFGPNTEQAIKAFQRLMGLDDDGVVGPRTRLKIKEKLGKIDIKFKSGELEIKVKDDGDDDDEVEIEIEDEDEDEDDDSDELEIEVEIEDGSAKIKIEYADGTKEEFSINSEDESEIIAYIESKTDLSESEIEAVVEFEIED